MTDKIKIPLSKSKIILLLVGALAFVFLGVYFTIFPEQFTSVIIKNVFVLRIIGIVSIVFFGISAIIILKKLFDKTSGVIIDENGITDNSNGTSIGFIKWSDIIKIREVQQLSQKFIMIDVSNPEKYIGLSKNKISKIAMKANYKNYGSPIGITANSLKINFTDLKNIIETEYAKNAIKTA